MFESSFRVFVSSFRRFVVSLRRFVSSSLLQFRLVSCYRFVISTFRCFTFLLRFVVPLAISSCRRPVLSFPCFDSSLLSSFRQSMFHFALDWERVKVQLACMLLRLSLVAALLGLQSTCEFLLS